MPLYGQSGYGYGRYGIADNGPIYKQSLSYYISLFTSQYRLSTKLSTWTYQAWTPYDNLTDAMLFIQQAYDLDYASGTQLDTIGLLIGQGRIVGFQPTNGISPILDDDTYKILLRARIYARNSWDGRLVSLYKIWQKLFPGGNLVINDNQNMTATIIVSGNLSSILIDLITNGYIVPRPEGVQYTYATANLPIFGNDQDTAYVAGVDKGHIT